MVRSFDMSAVMFSRHFFNLYTILNELHTVTNNNLLEWNSKNFHLRQKCHVNRQDTCFKQETCRKAHTGCSPEATRVFVQTNVRAKVAFRVSAGLDRVAGGNTMQAHKS